MNKFLATALGSYLLVNIHGGPAIAEYNSREDCMKAAMAAFKISDQYKANTPNDASPYALSFASFMCVPDQKEVNALRVTGQL